MLFWLFNAYKYSINNKAEIILYHPHSLGIYKRYKKFYKLKK